MYIGFMGQTVPPAKYESPTPPDDTAPSDVDSIAAAPGQLTPGADITVLGVHRLQQGLADDGVTPNYWYAYDVFSYGPDQFFTLADIISYIEAKFIGCIVVLRRYNNVRTLCDTESLPLP